MDLQTGLAFFKNWTCKSGVKRITIAWVGKLPLLPLYVQETYPFQTSTFGIYTLLYIVYRGFLTNFRAFQGEGEHLRGLFERRETPEGRFLRGGRIPEGRFCGCVSSSRNGGNDTGPKGGYETRLLQTDDASDEGDGVEV